jgi:hypothetical protein
MWAADYCLDHRPFFKRKHPLRADVETVIFKINYMIHTFLELNRFLCSIC